MGGSGGMFSRLVGQQAPAPTPARPGAAYQAPAANIYSPSFQTPIAQPIRGIGPQQYPQLQAALNNILARNLQNPVSLQPMAPQQRPMMPMPAYRPSALNYRPNMAPAQQSLGRVAVSVAEQQRRAAQAELDRMRAEEQARQQQQQFFGYWD